MSKKDNSEITLPEYIRHHVHSHENGHDIIIVSGKMHNERIMKIKCRWPKGKNPRTKPYHNKTFSLDAMRKGGGI